MGKQIIVMRHAKVDFDIHRWMRCKDLNQVIAQYNDASLEQGINRNLNLSEVDTIICSQKNRSITTAVKIFGKADVSSSLFNEAELPYLTFGILKLPVRIWFLVMRLVWRLGFSKNCESFYRFKQRVETAAASLLGFEGKTVVVGHGIFNCYLIKILQMNVGCKIINKSGQGHDKVTILSVQP